MSRASGLLAALALTLATASCSGGAASSPTITTAPPGTASPDTAASVAEVTTTTSITTTVPPPSVPAGSTTVLLDVDGLPRSYVLTVPPDLPTDAPAALVIDLHGLGSNPAGQEDASGWSRKAIEEGFVVAQPAARGELPTWNPQPGSPGSALDVAFLRTLVADVAVKVALDPNQIYASGFSNGGGMAHRLACDAADLVVAIGTVSGQYVAVDDCEPTQPVAVIAFHGTADIIVAYEGVGRLLPDIPTWARDWAERDACGPVPERERITDDVVRNRWFGCADDVEVQLYTIDEGAHAWPGSDRPGFFAPTQTIDATDLMWDFFRAHERG